VAIEHVFRGFAAVVTRWQTQVDPMHAVLRGEDRQLLQGCQFVTGTGCGIGKTGRNLVAPDATLCKDSPRRRVHEAFELGGSTTHVGWRAIDDCVNTFQGFPVLVDVINTDQQGIGASNTACALSNRLSLFGGVTIATMVNDGNAGNVSHAAILGSDQQVRP